MDELHKAGARLYIGHSASNMERNAGSGLPNAVVVSSAIPADNEEIVHAKLMGIPMLVLSTLSLYARSLFMSGESLTCHFVYQMQINILVINISHHV